MIEAFIFLARGRYLKLLPFKKVAPTLGEESVETSVITSKDEKVIKDVSYALQTMSRYTLWESACMVQAIAATRMLNRRNIETTLYLGIARDIEGKMHAHAWVRSGSIDVTGADVKQNFTVVNKFAGGPRNRGESFDKISRNQSG